MYSWLNVAIDSSDTRSPIGVTRACRAQSFTSPGMASLLHDNNLATSTGVLRIAGSAGASIRHNLLIPGAVDHQPTDRSIGLA